MSTSADKNKNSAKITETVTTKGSKELDTSTELANINVDNKNKNSVQKAEATNKIQKGCTNSVDIKKGKCIETTGRTIGNASQPSISFVNKEKRSSEPTLTKVQKRSRSFIDDKGDKGIETREMTGVKLQKPSTSTLDKKKKCNEIVEVTSGKAQKSSSFKKKTYIETEVTATKSQKRSMYSIDNKVGKSTEASEVTKLQKPSSSIADDKEKKYIGITGMNSAQSENPSCSTDDEKKDIETPEITATQKPLVSNVTEEKKCIDIMEMTSSKARKPLGFSDNKEKKGIETSETSATQKPLILTAAKEKRCIETVVMPPPKARKPSGFPDYKKKKCVEIPEITATKTSKRVTFADDNKEKACAETSKVATKEQIPSISIGKNKDGVEVEVSLLSSMVTDEMTGIDTERTASKKEPSSADIKGEECIKTTDTTTMAVQKALNLTTDYTERNAAEITQAALAEYQITLKTYGYDEVGLRKQDEAYRRFIRTNDMMLSVEKKELQASREFRLQVEAQWLAIKEYNERKDAEKNHMEPLKNSISNKEQKDVIFPDVVVKMEKPDDYESSTSPAINKWGGVIYPDIVVKQEKPDDYESSSNSANNEWGGIFYPDIVVKQEKPDDYESSSNSANNEWGGIFYPDIVVKQEKPDDYESSSNSAFNNENRIIYPDIVIKKEKPDDYELSTTTHNEDLSRTTAVNVESSNTVSDDVQSSSATADNSKSSNVTIGNEEEKRPIILVEKEIYIPTRETRPPEFAFVHDVDEYMARPQVNGDVEQIVYNLLELMRQYKIMKKSLKKEKKGAEEVIENIIKSRDLIEFLQKNQSEKNPKPVESWYLLCKDVYAKAKLNITNTVYFWLGANTMLEYTLDEAHALLSKNYVTAEENVESYDFDLEFLTTQQAKIHTFMARVLNWDLARRAKWMNEFSQPSTSKDFPFQHSEKFYSLVAKWRASRSANEDEDDDDDDDDDDDEDDDNDDDVEDDDDYYDIAK